MKCPVCNGTGNYSVWQATEIDCAYCRKSGKVGLLKWVYFIILVAGKLCMSIFKKSKSFKK